MDAPLAPVDLAPPATVLKLPTERESKTGHRPNGCKGNGCKDMVLQDSVSCCE